MNSICNFFATIDPEKVETWLKILALILAAVFFAWKICVGWFAANLDLSISSERVARDEENDFLAITVTLDKGTTDSVKLKDVSLRLTVEGKNEHIERIGFERLPTEGDRLRWPTDGTSPTDPLYLLAQGESLQLAKAYEVPSQIPATVEVAVLAKRAFYKSFQWRAFHISLPRSDRKEAKT